jgi:uroporphyrinogen decarboxylase
MAKRWTSRKRVEAALNHEISDRVPLDLNITLNAYIALRDHLGLPPEKEVIADRFFEVRPSFDLLDALGVDITYVKLRGSRSWSPPPPQPDGTILDAWGVGRKLIELPDGSFLNEVVHCPLEGLDPDEIALDDYPWPDPSDPGFTAGLEEEAKRLYQETDYALMGRFGGPIMEIGTYLRGFEGWLMDLILHPEFARDLLNRIADIQIILDEAGIKAAGKYLSIFKVSGEDLGTQTNTLFSYQVWEDIIYPILARRWKSAREALDTYDASHVKLMLHSDGAFRPFIPDIIKAGVDILDPIQKVCPGMDLEGLKRDFGDQLVFHGSVDTQYYLPRGSVDEVRQETKYCIDTLGKGGGLILGPSHFIQPDVPPENIEAMYATARNHDLEVNR